MKKKTFNSVRKEWGGVAGLNVVIVFYILALQRGGGGNCETNFKEGFGPDATV